MCRTHSVSREPKGDVSWSCREIVELVVEESCSDDVEVDRAGRWSFFRSMSGRSGWAIAFVGRSGRDRTTFSKHGKTRREIAATMRDLEKQQNRDFRGLSSRAGFNRYFKKKHRKRLPKASEMDLKKIQKNHRKKNHANHRNSAANQRASEKKKYVSI